MLHKSEGFTQGNVGFQIIRKVFLVSEKMRDSYNTTAVFLRSYIWLATEVSYTGTNRTDLYFPNVRLHDVQFGAAPVSFRIFHPCFVCKLLYMPYAKS